MHLAGVGSGFRSRLGGSAAGQERGFALVEVVVSALLLVIVSAGIFSALSAANRSTSEERHRARADGLAQDDLARMRSMQISDLSNLSQTRTITKDGTPYTVLSETEFLTDSTGTASCDAGTASADYIKISSTVSWPSIGSRPPVYAASIVAPPNGSISANSGALAISVENAASVGIPGIGLSGTGAGSFSGDTGTTGCAIFGDLPAGSYTLTVSGIAAGLVDPDGKPPAPKTVSVVGESTNTVALQYDTPASIPVTFKTKSTSGTTVTLSNSASDVISAFNTGMTVPRTFGTAGSRVSSLTATSLFPFVSPYSVYAGSCEANNPNPDDDDTAPGALASASVTVPPGGSSAGVVQLPAANVIVYQGSSNTTTKAVGAAVKIRDVTCGNAQRSSNGLVTITGGQLPAADQGLPYSADYTFCATQLISGTTRRQIIHKAIIDPVNPTKVEILLQGTGSTSGSGLTCP